MENSQDKLTKKLLDQYFGLYVLSSRVAVPLKDLKVDAYIDFNVARVKYNQKFVNESDELIEVEYFFPLSQSICYDGLRIKTGEDYVDAVIKEKESAKEEYDSKVSEGATVAYAEAHDSILNLKIGNIEPHAEVEVEVSYIEFLTISTNKYWKFQLYSSLMPNPEQNSSAGANEYPISDGSSTSINLTIDIGSRTFGDIECVSHEGVQIDKVENQGIATISFNSDKGGIPSKDFVLLYEYSDIEQPVCLLQKYKEQFGAYITYFPKINLKKRVKEDVEQSQEYIFLIDNSARMGEESLTNIIRAIKIMLITLPDEVKFRIITICGDRLELESNSEEDTKFIVKNRKSLADAIQFANNLQVDNSQQTDFLSILGEVLKPTTDQNQAQTSQNIFLLSDGSFENEKDIIKQVTENIGQNQQIYALGLGKNINEEFLKDLCKEGRGLCEIKSKTESLSQKAGFLLRNSFHQYVSDFALQIDEKLKECINYIVPDPQSLNHIIPNQLISFFVLLNNKFADLKVGDFTLKYFDSSKGETTDIKITINLDQVLNSSNIIKLGMYHFSQNLEKMDKIFIADSLKDEDVAMKSQINEVIIQASIETGFLTERTAFFCKLKDSDDVMKQIPRKKYTPLQENAKSGSLEEKEKAKLSPSASKQNESDDESDPQLGGGGGADEKDNDKLGDQETDKKDDSGEASDDGDNESQNEGKSEPQEVPQKEEQKPEEILSENQNEVKPENDKNNEEEAKNQEDQRVNERDQSVEDQDSEDNKEVELKKETSEKHDKDKQEEGTEVKNDEQDKGEICQIQQEGDQLEGSEEKKQIELDDENQEQEEEIEKKVENKEELPKKPAEKKSNTDELISLDEKKQTVDEERAEKSPKIIQEEKETILQKKEESKEESPIKAGKEESMTNNSILSADDDKKQSQENERGLPIPSKTEEEQSGVGSNSKSPEKGWGDSHGTTPSGVTTGKQEMKQKSPEKSDEKANKFKAEFLNELGSNQTTKTLEREQEKIKEKAFEDIQIQNTVKNMEPTSMVENAQHDPRRPSPPKKSPQKLTTEDKFQKQVTDDDEFGGFQENSSPAKQEESNTAASTKFDFASQDVTPSSNDIKKKIEMQKEQSEQDLDSSMVSESGRRSRRVTKKIKTRNKGKDQNTEEPLESSRSNKLQIADYDDSLDMSSLSDRISSDQKPKKLRRFESQENKDSPNSNQKMYQSIKSNDTGRYNYKNAELGDVTLDVRGSGSKGHYSPVKENYVNRENFNLIDSSFTFQFPTNKKRSTIVKLCLLIAYIICLPCIFCYKLGSKVVQRFKSDQNEMYSQSIPDDSIYETDNSQNIGNKANQKPVIVEDPAKCIKLIKDVCAEQQGDGHWNFSEAVQKLLRVNELTMKSTIPKDLEPMDNAEDVWTTFLIMTCLNIKHKDLYSDYLQNYVNAQSYLAKEEFDEDDYKSVAKVVIEDAE